MNLAFLRPEFLWGLALVALPILIHFFNRKRTVKLDFSTLRFWLETAIKANRARSLRRWLQLLARVLIVTLLVLIFSRPRSRDDVLSVLADPQVTLLSWIDPTVSMEYRTDGTSRFEAACRLRDSAEAGLPASADRLRWDETSGAFVRAADSDSREKRTRHGPSGFGRAATALAGSASRPAGPQVFLVLSDLQIPTTQAIDSVLAAAPLAGPVICVSLAPAKPWNYGVAGAAVAAENGALVQAGVYAIGRNLTAGGVHAAMAGMRVGGAVVSVKAGDTVTAALDIPAAGGAAGSVVLETTDPFPPDDSCAFARAASRARNALIVGDPTASYPLAAALRTAGRGFWGSVVVKGEVEATLEDLDAAALIILNGVTQPVSAVRSLLATRALSNKAVVYSPSLAPEASMLNRQVLERLGWRGAVTVDSAPKGLTAVLPDTLSALWRGFPRLCERDAAIYAWLGGLPGEVLLRLENGRPLAARCRDSSGHAWVLAATPLGVSNANNLCETGFYVALVDRLSRHALGAAASDADAWVAGRPRRNPYFGTRGGAQVYNADNTPLVRWESQPMVVLSRPGVYRVQPDGGTGYWVRAVFDPQETDFTYRNPVVPPEKRRLVTVVSAEELPALLANAGRRTMVKWLWVMLVGCVLGEMVLGWRRGETKK